MNQVVNNRVPFVASGMTESNKAGLDNERADWLAASQAMLLCTWDNAGDGTFDELLVKSTGDGCQAEFKKQ
jgi:hypothetical protein